MTSSLQDRTSVCGKSYTLSYTYIVELTTLTEGHAKNRFNPK